MEVAFQPDVNQERGVLCKEMFLETVESTLNVNTRPIPPCADFPINTVAGDSSLLITVI